MRKLLIIFALVLAAGCAPATVPKPEGPPSLQEECMDGCLNEYSACIIECDKTVAIGPELDHCIQQCKEKWAECKEDCSKAGNLQ
ncbi:MAG: hypothetical protein LJE89_05260 [Deltaproteobacteria bacterium]|nr:hypothetical protein [Deltaproteobacteria bacterium]